MLTVTRAAFGEGPPADEEVTRWEGHAVAALADGQVLGSACWTTVIGEIVAVAVVEPARQRGVGTTLAVAATRGAFAQGASMALLTPG